MVVELWLKQIRLGGQIYTARRFQVWWVETIRGVVAVEEEVVVDL